MERVAFLIEKTGESISCLLNPESLVARRRAGIRSLRTATGVVTGEALSDDPMTGTGGGVTEYELDLLFDVDLADEESVSGTARGSREVGFADEESVSGAASGSGEAGGADEESVGGGASGSGEVGSATPGAGEPPLAQQAAVLGVPIRRPPRDVRELTRPFWALSENAAGGTGYSAPPVVRMIWGRAWNVLGVVVAAAERLERFSEGGVPRRSWLRLRLRRVPETLESRTTVPAPVTPQFELPPLPGAAGSAGEAVAVNVAPDGLPVDRLDQIAADVYGDPNLWRLIAAANDLDDPLNLPEGAVLAIPPVAGAP